MALLTQHDAVDFTVITVGNGHVVLGSLATLAMARTFAAALSPLIASSRSWAQMAWSLPIPPPARIDTV
jgi:hypothetical protein